MSFTTIGRIASGVFLLACLSVASPVFAQSQATTGVIEGSVSDTQGGRLPGASVTLLNTGTNFSRELATDQDGRFRGLLLPLGSYRLTVVLQGFATYVQEGIQLAVGQTANIPVVLQLAGVTQEVTVTADSPVVETTRAEGGRRFGSFSRHPITISSSSSGTGGKPSGSTA